MIPVYSSEAYDAELCGRSLPHFVRGAWHVIEPTTPLDWAWHLDAICEHLTAVTDGQIRDLVINVPPGHMKSILTAVMWPCWEWLRFPEKRWIFASYAAHLSLRDSRKCLRLIGSDWYQGRWRDRFAVTRGAEQKFENDRTGFRLATSVGGVGTGERANRLVVDDPHNVKERESEAIRFGTLDWWDNAFGNRQCDYREDARVIIMQRVHWKDLAGHVLARDGWEHLCLPTEYEPARRCVTSVGWEDPRSADGELLFPLRFGPEQVAKAKVEMGPLNYAGQHQQRPSPAEGARFRKADFRYFAADGEFYVLYQPDGTRRVVKKDDCDLFGMMDPAGAEKDQDNRPCYTVVWALAMTPAADMLVLDEYRGQIQAADAPDAAATFARRHDLAWVGVEKNGIGLGVVQTLKRKSIAVKPILAKGSKEARSETAEIWVAAGKIYLPQGHPALWDIEEELTRFPNGEFCDRVDVLSYAAKEANRRYGTPTTPADDAWRQKLVARGVVDARAAGQGAKAPDADPAGVEPPADAPADAQAAAAAAAEPADQQAAALAAIEADPELAAWLAE